MAESRKRRIVRKPSSMMLSMVDDGHVRLRIRIVSFVLRLPKSPERDRPHRQQL